MVGYVMKMWAPFHDGLCVACVEPLEVEWDLDDYAEPEQQAVVGLPSVCELLALQILQQWLQISRLWSNLIRLGLKVDYNHLPHEEGVWPPPCIPSLWQGNTGSEKQCAGH